MVCGGVDMLAKKEVIDICSGLNFDPAEYCVGFGAALVLYGIKESTADIDLCVTNDLFNTLSERYKPDYTKFNEPYIYIDGVVEVFRNSNMNTKAYIDGIPVSSLKDIILSKKRLGRPKDIIDIKRIEEFIADAD
jgi:hypothetical protein